VLSILSSRIYLGEVQMNGEWFPGNHEPIITPELFSAAHRGRIRGRRKGRDLLGGKVRCRLLPPAHGDRPKRPGHLLLPVQAPGSGLRPTPPVQLRAAASGRARASAHR
jgi:hypothetical protein